MDEKTLAKPTGQQALWQDMEMGLFCHFGLNTFNDHEWGDGTDSPHSFNPTALDCRQWARTAKRAGFKYLILTAKHHDGFCLWPTNTTDYSVCSSPWKNGKGDVVLECAKACREEGILFGLYLSPWDRHEICYPNPKDYDDFYARQLSELLTQYGPLVEVWFDGAGSEGRTYDWRRITDLVHKHQPDAMIFNMGCPTIRWVGNEDGLAPYPCWNTVDEARISMFTENKLIWLPDTPQWVPAECDVSIRKQHWFWHPNDEKSLYSKEELIDIYYRSVGHGANLLLNISPDPEGLLPECDVERVVGLGDEITRRFHSPIGETSGTGCVLELVYPQDVLLNHLVLMEEISEGERVQEYVLEALHHDGWMELVHGSAIGHKKIDVFQAIRTCRLRLRVTQSMMTPIIRRMAAFYI